VELQPCGARRVLKLPRFVRVLKVSQIRLRKRFLFQDDPVARFLFHPSPANFIHLLPLKLGESVAIVLIHVVPDWTS